MIDVEGISKSFGETRALAGVDMSVPAGTVQGLPGPNGAGPGHRPQPDQAGRPVPRGGREAHRPGKPGHGRADSAGSRPSWPRPGPGSPSSVSPSWRQIAVYPLIPATTPAAASVSTAITG